ncbi:minor capsid protein [Acetoanaerobium noterae]|uniref:minor capsid protein n=1 Tax=Acetoanaerobium noterae TaxID=745369 RepID=UPI00333F1F1E
MNHSEYWIIRSEQLHEQTFSESNEYAQNIEEAYKKAASELNKEIYNFLKKIASNNEMSLSEAKKLLSNKELEEFKWTVEEYIEKGSGILSEKTIKQLENASAATRISYLNSMNLQMRYHVEKLYSQQGIDVKDKMKSIFENHYYNVIYEVSSIVNPDRTFSKLNEKEIEAVLSRPWTSDGKNFSKRIWENQERLINELQITLQQSFIRGESPDKAINRISKLFDVKKSNASNLVMTESAYFASEGDGMAYKELGLEKYEILATLDMKTSDICQSLDGKVFNMKEYSAGITAPPFHCRCRTTTIPVVEGFDDELEERAARDLETGETYYVPGKIKFDEWKKTHILDSFNKKGYNIITSNGISINENSIHALERAEERGISKDEIINALLMPLQILEPRIDEIGRKSQRFIGNEATVNINPDIGTVITVWKTGKKTREKLERRK